MATFPSDMNIGWGFGQFADHYPRTAAEMEENEPQPTDPLLAVSELEQRVIEIEKKLGEVPEEAVVWYCILDLRVTQQSDRRVLEGIRDMVYDHSDVLKQAIQHITDLEERLRSLTFVVNELVARLDSHIKENTIDMEEFDRIGQELEKE